MARLSIARQLSYDALCRVIKAHVDPSLALGEAIAERSSIQRIDRNLAFEITFGSLRWWKKIYWILQHHAKRDLDECSVVVRVALVAGTYQIYYLDRVPDRASVNESVEYVRQRRESKAVPFVNGILRQVATRARYFPKPNYEEAPVEYLALQYAHPEWLVKRWLTRFGYKRLEGMFKQSNQRPPVTVRLNLAKVQEFEAVRDMQRHLLRTEKLRTTKRPLKFCFHAGEKPSMGEESLFADGYFTIQDESSQLIAPLLNIQAGESVVDACAGPGGKLTHIYELMMFPNAHFYNNVADVDNAQDDNKALTTSASVAKESVLELSGSITAFEKKSLAYKRMLENLKRLQCHGVQCFAQDFLSYKPAKAPDKILLDAPCSALGVLRRHPEGKLFKEEFLIGEMAQKQRELLAHGFRVLAPGGELVYSVCSFESEETEDHISWLEETFPSQFSIISPRTRLQAYYRKYVTSNKLLLVYSGNTDAMDGFCAFIIQKH